MTQDLPETFEPRLSMGARIRAAGDGAVPLLVKLQQKAALHALVAIMALEPEDETDGPDLGEVRDRLGRIVGLLLVGEA